MAASKINGMDTFQTQFENLAREIGKINRGALGSAAGLVADEMKAALEALPTHEEGQWGTETNKLYGVTPSEKEQLINALGIAPFRGTTDIDTAIGFHGYVETPSNRFNDHVPAGMLMQCIEYGTSFRQGTHTLTGVMKKLKTEAVKAAQDYIDTETQKIMEV
jgi:hypothetical protein